MKNFDRNNRSSGSGRDNKWSKKRDFGDSRGPRPMMHQAICSECGQKCEVPFKPTGDRPVFCSTCFEKQGGKPTSGGDRGGRSFSRPSFDQKRMFEAVCSKCGNKCEVPFRPTGDKPVYCSQCFDKNSSAPSKSSDQYKAPDQFKQQFEALNYKLDKILQALNPSAAVKASKVVKAKKVIKAKKEVKKIKAVPKTTKTKKRK